MYSKEIEELIDAALADGVLTDKEREILYRRAQAQDVDMDEFEMVLNGRLVNKQQQLSEKKQQQAAASNHAKVQSNKYGTTRKCPACGALVKSFEVVCPECGHEFTNVAAASTLQLFYDKLTKADGRADKCDIIKALPVPNTREDLFEVLNMAVSSAAALENDKWSEDERDAWVSKANQVYQKIMITMAGDQAMLNKATDQIIYLLEHLPKEKQSMVAVPPSMQPRVKEAMKRIDNKFAKRKLIVVAIAVAIPIFCYLLYKIMRNCEGNFCGLVALLAVMGLFASFILCPYFVIAQFSKINKQRRHISAKDDDE